jgi:hypothetical protein
MTVVVLLVTILMFWSEEAKAVLRNTKTTTTTGKQPLRVSHPSIDHHKNVNDSSSTIADGSSTAAAPPESVTSKSHYSYDTLRDKLDVARQRMIDTLKQDYGPENYQTMFVVSNMNGTNSSSSSTSVGRTLFTSANDDGPSWGRLKRKILMKLLSVQIAAAAATTDDAPVQFVWATGGHSVTAGHGNFYSESYTAVLQRAVKDAFLAVGIDFNGRNYAMGASSSAPETAFCLNEIYGNDIDVLVWDFSLTDGRRDVAKMALFLQRAGTHNRARPVNVAYHVYKEPKRIEMLRTMEDRGLAILYSRQEVLDNVEASIPDTLGMSEEEIQAMPRFVRNYKCGNLIEAGDPYCKADKFNDTMCAVRKYKTSWHPGW